MTGGGRDAEVHPSDRDVWARAQAALHSTPPEPAHLQAARERYDRRLTRVSIALTGTAVAMGLVVALVDQGDGASPWRAVASVTVVVLAVCLMTVGPLSRPLGSSRELTRPLDWLTRAQRGELRRHVRDGDAGPARLPLARMEARAMIDRRVDELPLVGLVLASTGWWILDHSWSRTVPTVALVAASAVVALHRSRDERLARRFLDEHPDPGGR